MYLIALLAVLALVAVFGVQNDGTQNFTLLGYTWTLQTWAPTAIAAGLVSALLLLHMGAAGVGHRFRQFGHGRALGEHRDVIEELRSENGRLREELAAVKGEVRGVRSATGGQPRSLMEGLRTLPNRLAGGRNRPSAT